MVWVGVYIGKHSGMDRMGNFIPRIPFSQGEGEGVFSHIFHVFEYESFDTYSGILFALTMQTYT